MDKMILRSECPLRNVDRYAVAHYTKGEGLCLTPVDCIMPLKPGMEYIDKSNERAKKEKSEEEDAEEGLQNLLPELFFYVFETRKGLCCRYVFLCFQSIIKLFKRF